MQVKSSSAWATPQDALLHLRVSVLCVCAVCCCSQFLVCLRQQPALRVLLVCSAVGSYSHAANLSARVAVGVSILLLSRLLSPVRPTALHLLLKCIGCVEQPAACLLGHRVGSLAGLDFVCCHSVVPVCHSFRHLCHSVLCLPGSQASCRCWFAAWAKASFRVALCSSTVYLDSAWFAERVPSLHSVSLCTRVCHAPHILPSGDPCQACTLCCCVDCVAMPLLCCSFSSHAGLYVLSGMS